MELQQLFKNAKAFIFTKNSRTVTESDDQIFVEFINTLSPGVTPCLLAAEIPYNLGRSEKFLTKLQNFSVLAELGFLDSVEKKVKKVKCNAFSRIEPDHVPLSVSHLFHKKSVSPFSPGVVRIRSTKTVQGVSNIKNQTDTSFESRKTNKITTKNNFRYSAKSGNLTPQPARSVREIKHESPQKLQLFKANSSTKTLSSSANCLKVKETQQPTKSNEIVKYIGNFNLGYKEGQSEITYKNGDVYKGQLVKDKKQGVGCYFWSKYNLTYKGEFLNDLPHGSGKLKFSTGEYYKGSFSSGKLKDGFTSIRFKDLSIYEGDTKNGKRKGNGRIEYKQGGIYYGLWDNDQRNGEGVIEHHEFEFEGSFVSDIAEGPGVLVYKKVFDGVKGEKKVKISKFVKRNSKSPFVNSELMMYLKRFSILSNESRNLFYFVSVPGKFVTSCGDSVPDGKFVAGRLNGAGFARFGPYGMYLGPFKNGLFSGYGQLIYSDPMHKMPSLAEYEGEYKGYFKEHKRHGNGQMTWPNSTQYKGNFFQDRRHNVQGTLSLKNGDTFSGTWIDNKMEGFIMICKKSGMKAKVQFVSSVLHAVAQLFFVDGSVYEGDTQNLVPHGRGIMKWPNSKQFQGEFFNGNIDGSGRMLYENGDIYEGRWENGLRSGKGSFLCKSASTKYEGEYLDNKKSGEGVLKTLDGKVLFSGFWNNDEPVL